MKMQKYSVNQHLIENLLSWVTSGEIAIPEIQRPFVWDASKVRDLMDSLYRGYPVGYIIAWRNPDVQLKDGTTSSGKKVLIDGQQRITALTAAVLGQVVVNKHYKRGRICIAFDPQIGEFAVQTPVIVKNRRWIADIAPLLSGEVKQREVERRYLAENRDADEDVVFGHLDALYNVTKKQIGVIELDSDLDIDTVTEIFIRINSKGVVLSQADFAMSKIAANETYGGTHLRKIIDYFCHLAVAPGFCEHIENNDAEFAASDAFGKIRWLREENDDLYDPAYTDMLRVAFTSEFSRGKLSDLVNLLSGRNFELRTFEESIAEASFAKLQAGVMRFVNKTHFKRFLMIVRSAGFVDKKQIRSMNVLNFAYIVYLKLRRDDVADAEIESSVRRWLVLSILTGRYSGSSESQMDHDIRAIDEKGLARCLADVEAAELGEAFWEAALPQGLTTSSASSPLLGVFLACQARAGDKGFLSSDITVRDMLLHRGDVHHIFPKAYLRKHGLTRGRYNQIANFCYMQQEINIKVGDQPPASYFAALQAQIASGECHYGGIQTTEALMENLAMSCVPREIQTMDISGYESFLEARRLLMARRIQTYYEGL